MAKVVHFEIPADNVDRAKNFYGSIFGWELQTMPMGEGEYTSVQTTDVNEQTRMPLEPGAINGGMMQRTEQVSGPVITIDVDGIDDALKKIESEGGSTITPRTPNPWHGRLRLLQGSGGQRAGSVGDHALDTP